MQTVAKYGLQTRSYNSIVKLTSSHFNMSEHVPSSLCHCTQNVTMKDLYAVPWCRRTIFFLLIIANGWRETYAVIRNCGVGISCIIANRTESMVPHGNAYMKSIFFSLTSIRKSLQSVSFIFNRLNWVRKGWRSENILCDYQMLCGIQHRRIWSISYLYNGSRWHLHYDRCDIHCEFTTSRRVLIAFEFHLSMRANRVHKFIWMDSKAFCGSRR